MQTWEYLTIQADGVPEKIETVNGTPLSTGAVDHLASFLNDLGQLGWEVVSADIVPLRETGGVVRDFRIFVMLKHPTP